MKLKFPAGTFLEIDDRRGGRQIVMVCRDGFTFLESLGSDAAPVQLHPVLNATPLGGVLEFIEAHGLAPVITSARSLMRARMDPRVEDLLFTMRVAHKLAELKTRSGAADWAPTDAELESAVSDADIQGQNALRSAAHMARFAGQDQPG